MEDIKLNDIEQAVDYLKQMFDKIKSSIDKDKPKNLTRQQKCAEILFCDIFYITENYLTILEKSRNIIGLSSLIRSLLERCIDLFLVCIDVKYMKNFQLDALTERKKYLKNVKEEKDKDPNFWPEIKYIGEKIRNTENDIKSLKAERVVVLSFKQKLEKIPDFTKIYLAYCKLSDKTHSNLLEMTIKYDNKKHLPSNSFRCPEFNNEDYLMHIHFIAQILLHSFSEVMKIIYKKDSVPNEIVNWAENIKSILSRNVVAS